MPLGYFVAQHTLERIREYWASEVTMRHRRLLEYIATSISNALNEGRAVVTPSGTFVPFELNGKRLGYLVVNGNRVSTALPLRFCPDVDSLFKEKEMEKNGSI